jgi:hypothetical protein
MDHSVGSNPQLTFRSLTLSTEYGDSGSWIIDPSSGSLCGYIATGDPCTSIAYIIPAYQAFSDIEQRLGRKITFPSAEKLSPLPWGRFMKMGSTNITYL